MPFNESDIQNIAQSLRSSMKGLGTDEKRLIRELASISNEQRQMVKLKYISMFGKPIEEDIKQEVGGYFQKTLLQILAPLYEFEAQCIRNAVDVKLDFFCK